MSTCPPCNQKCNQGRDCPANKQGHAETMKRALTALEIIERFLDPLAKWQVRKPKDGGPMITVYPQKVAEEAINDLRQAVAETEKQEPSVDVRAWFTIDEINAWADKKLKENPQWAAQPSQQPLTDKQIFEIWEEAMVKDNGKYARLDNQPFVHFARAIERAHGIKEKNHG